LRRNPFIASLTIEQKKPFPGKPATLFITVILFTIFKKLELLFIMYFKLYTCFFLAYAFFAPGCNTNREYKSPAGYNLNRPHVTKMGNELREISGISLLNGNAGRFYAINDEEGKLYTFSLQEKKTTVIKFAKPGDYEDISITANTIIVMKSNGELFYFPVNFSETTENPKVVDVLKSALPKNEYEGLYADVSGRLYVLCKNCSVDEPEKEVSIYSLSKDSSGSYFQDTIYHINVTAIGTLLKESKLRFMPSALAINPLNGDWFILSSINKMLVVTDNNFSVKEAYKLDPSLFRQPEGIIFDKDGNMYISNEGKDKDADILSFKYTAK